MLDQWETVNQVAERWGTTRQLVYLYIKQGRVKGHCKVGSMILLPVGVKKPRHKLSGAPKGPRNG